MYLVSEPVVMLIDVFVSQPGQAILNLMWLLRWQYIAQRQRRKYVILLPVTMDLVTLAELSCSLSMNSSQLQTLYAIHV